MIDDTEGCLRKSLIKNNLCYVSTQAWVLMLQWFICPPLWHSSPLLNNILQHCCLSTCQGHGYTFMFNLNSRVIPNNKGKETLSTRTASNVSAVVSHLQSWKEMVLTKTFNIGKKPLESEHRLVQIFKENLFPVRIRPFPLTMCNYLPLI